MPVLNMSAITSPCFGYDRSISHILGDVPVYSTKLWFCLFINLCIITFRWICFIFEKVPPEDKRAISSLWGKLASEILMQNWDAALEDLQRLQEVIDSNVSNFWGIVYSATFYLLKCGSCFFIFSLFHWFFEVSSNVKTCKV